MPEQRPPTDLSESLDSASATQDSSRLGRDIYGELHRLAQVRMAGLPAGNTLQPTALVHEVWLRLQRNAEDLQRKRIYFAAAARAMRDILVEQARSKARLKRGGGAAVQRGTVLAMQADTSGLAHDDMIALREVLDRLEEKDSRKAEVVLLRFFGGLQQAEIAVLLDVTERTVERDWRFAKAWLRAELEDRDDG